MPLPIRETLLGAPRISVRNPSGIYVRDNTTSLWTCRRVAQVIRDRFDVHYHPDHIGRLLRACGFTPQRPQTVARERNDQRIREWVQQEWTRAKKNSPTSRHA